MSLSNHIAHLLLFVFFFIPGTLFAHGDSFSYEAEVNGYVVDVGYSTETPTLGDVVLFDFALLRDGGVIDDYSDVWVRIVDERDTTVLATGVHQPRFGGARLSYAFPREGAYIIHIRFQREEETYAESSFTLRVLPEQRRSSPSLMVSLVAVLVGILIGVGVGKKWRTGT